MLPARDGGGLLGVSTRERDLRETDRDGGVIREQDAGAPELPGRFVRAAEPELQLAEARVGPCLRLDVARTGGFGRHPHQLERAAQIALQLPRVADARVRRASGGDRDHAIERGEPFVVVAELDAPVADDALQRRVVRTTGGEAFGLGGGFGELVPRQRYRSKHALHRLIAGAEPLRRARDLLGAHRQRGVPVTRL